MKYPHVVKYQGVWYPAGANVPTDTEPPVTVSVVEVVEKPKAERPKGRKPKKDKVQP